MSNSLIAKYQRVESIIAQCKLRANPNKPTVMWIRSSEWGEFAAEVAAIGTFKDGTGNPTNANFKWAAIGKNLKVANAGTDDEKFVNAMNQREVPPDFAYWRDHFISGRASDAGP